MPQHSDDLSTTLDRADRGLDHCPPDEHRERTPLDPSGAVMATVLDTIADAAAELRSRPIDTVCGACRGRGYHRSATAVNDGAVADIECSKCGGRGVYPVARFTGFPTEAERRAAQAEAAERRLDAQTVHGAQGNAARNRGLDDSAAPSLAASTSTSSTLGPTSSAPAPTSRHACAVIDEARARAILGIDVSGFYLRNAVPYLQATGDADELSMLGDVVSAVALLKSALETRAALARVRLDVSADVADELERRGGLTAPSTSCSTGTVRCEG